MTTSGIPSVVAASGEAEVRQGDRIRGVLLFGASSMGRQLAVSWPAHLRPLLGVLDNNPRTWGTRLEGLPVISPEALRDADLDDLFVVIGSQYYEDIARQLTDLGLIEAVHFGRAADLDGYPALVTAGDRSKDALALVVKNSWFEIDWTQFSTLCRGEHVRLAYAPVPREERREAVDVTPDTLRTARRHGVPLMAACAYDICVSLRVPIEQLDPRRPDHWDVIVEHLRHAAAIIDMAAGAVDRMRPHIVVIPQGYTKVAAIYRYLSILRGIRVLALENTLNRHRLMWDDVAGLAVNRVVARNYFWRWADLVDPAEARAHRDWYLASIKELKGAAHESPERGWVPPAGAGRTVVFLANVLTDSSVMFNSRVGSQIEAIKAAARWCVSEGCTFVLKVHPRERPGHCAPYEGLTVRALQEDAEFWQLATASPRIVIDRDNRFDTYDLIRKADACITTCSQAGLEALLMDREVVLLGDAYYGGLGFTHDVHDRRQIGAALRDALDPALRRLDADRVATFFYVLDRIYCVEKSERGLLDLVRRALGRAPLAVGG